MNRGQADQTPVFFTSAEAFRTWLERHAATTAELVVGFYKVGSGRPSLSWPESVEEALCFGWVDGVRKRIDHAAYQIRFSPRRTGAVWSAINIAKAEQLIAQGRMRSTGLSAYAARTERASRAYAYEQNGIATLRGAEASLFRRAAGAWLSQNGDALD